MHDRHACLYFIGEIKMKNITKKKIVLVTLGFLLGFSMIIFTNYQEKLKTDNQPNLKTPNSSQGTEIYTIANISGHLWSPDGTKVAYIKCPSLEMWNCELWVADKNPLDAELINHVLISSEAEYNGLLDWQGDWILFRIRHEQGTPASYYGRGELWRIRADGTGMAQVTFTQTNGIRTQFWNPAYDNRGTAGWGRFIPGTALVYFHAHDGNGWPMTFVCNADGTDSWYHISHPDNTWRPALSPTGNKLLWGEQFDFGQPTTHKACNVDGSGRTTIKAFTTVIEVTVLADGNTVIWTDNDNIYAIDMDGTNERTVLDDAHINWGWNYNPSDGQGLIMGSNRSDGNMHIYKINVDGTGIEQLTEGPYLDEGPILSPDGQYLSYLRLPYDFDKGSSTIPYPYELVVKSLVHDLSVSLEAPIKPEIGNSYMINATVNNTGVYDEYDVELLLYLDDIIVESTTISSLPVGVSETINYMWTPTEYKTYNFTAYTSPVPGETNLGNNNATSLITVYMLINYIMTPGAPYNWIDASGGTELLLSDDGYSTVSLPFEFQFYNDTFSTIYLGANGYLSFVDPSPSDYSNDLIPSGDLDNYYLIAPFWDDLQPASGGGSGNIYVQSFGTYWVAEWLNINHYNGGLVGSFEVILNETGEIIFNYDYIDYYSGYTCGLNLGVDTQYYNSYQGLDDLTDDFSIQFAYELPDHDLVVSLETPIMAEVGNTYMIDATVSNNGLNDEYDVDLFLYLDDVIVESTTISSLPVGVSETINYLWTPTELGEYIFSVYAPPVPGELLIENNLEFKTIYIALSSEISGPVAIFRNVLPWGYNVTEPILNMYGIDYTIYDSSNMGTVDLTQYEKVIIESDQDQLFYDTLGSYIPWFESYAVNGGILEIHACDGGWNGGYWDGYYLMPGGIDQVHTSTDSISINILGHPIVNKPHIITDTELDGWSSSAHGSFITYPEISKQVLLDSNTLNPVFIELDFGEGTILATMQTLEFSYSLWETGTSQSITWTSSGTISNVKLELYKDDVFVMEIISSTPNDGEYLWAIPSGLDDSAQYQIKISDVTKPATDDFSDYFEILTPVIDSLTVTTPDSLTAWEMGTSQDITWTSIGSIADVKIELYKDGVFEMEIVASTANDGSYNWGIPTDLEDGIDYQIRISDVLNPATYDESPNFAITSADIPFEIPSYNLYIVIAIMCVVSVILFKKRFKLIK